MKRSLFPFPLSIFHAKEIGNWKLEIIFFAGILASIALAFPARAADICCNCTPPDNAKKSCLTFDATKLSKADDCTSLPAAAKLPDGWFCDPVKIDLPAKCKSVTNGGICQAEPVSALSMVGEAVTKAAAGSNAKPVPPIPFTLNVPIPGYTPPADMTEAFNTYIYAVYRYAISIAAIAATIMFIYGAFRYLVGSSLGDVARGKEVMIDAVIGLFLILSATMILRTINPALTQLKSIVPTDIETKVFDTISDAGYSTLTGGPKISRADMFALAQDKAKATGLPELPCLVRASMQFESGGRVDVVGHDESFQGTAYAVGSRQKFLKGGVTFKNVSFTPVDCPDPSCQKDKQINDDVFNPNDPPDFGLDWKYSHGFGAGQSTIFPNDPRNKPCPGKESQGRGFRVGTKCFTIPELISGEGAAAAMVEHFRLVFTQSGRDPAQTFVNYAGSGINGGKDNPAIVARMKAYQQCRDSGQ
jgi:hypothetical protein